MVDRLTTLVYQRCNGSMYDEHRLLFATLLCLNIQEENNAFSEEELSLLLQGALLIHYCTCTKHLQFAFIVFRQSWLGHAAHSAGLRQHWRSSVVVARAEVGGRDGGVRAARTTRLALRPLGQQRRSVEELVPTQRTRNTCAASQRAGLVLSLFIFFKS